MFTGIIHHLGRVVSVSPTAAGARLAVNSPWAEAPDPPRPGDSIAVDGACLTLVRDAPPGLLAFDVVPETLARTTLGSFIPGRRVHLERSLRVGDRLDGHIVLGHVDGTAECVEVATDGQWRVRFRPPAELAMYMVPKGSVALDGVSLTVASVYAGGDFDVALVPTTLELTHLGELRPGDRVNLECDHTVKTIVATLQRLGVLTGAPDGAAWPR
ncbi:MAG: riboflavin synthase [Tepidisphaerales bacterium]